MMRWWITDGSMDRLLNRIRYGTESPSKYCALLAPRLPFTHSFGLQPVAAPPGPAALAHWSRLAAGLAARTTPIQRAEKTRNALAPPTRARANALLLCLG